MLMMVVCAGGLGINLVAANVVIMYDQDVSSQDPCARCVLLDRLGLMAVPALLSSMSTASSILKTYVAHPFYVLLLRLPIVPVTAKLTS